MTHNPFTRLVQEAREQGKARDALIRRATPARPAIVASCSIPYASHTLETIEASARVTGEARRATRHNVARKMRLWAGRQTLPGGHYCYAWQGRPTVARRPRNMQLDRMNHVARWLIGEIRCSAVRESLPTDLRKDRTYRMDGTQATTARRKATYDPAPYRGLVSAREARVSERGASGIKGVRGAAARVSVRDNHSPTEVLRVMPSVGVATHPRASDADYDYMIRLIRKTPSLATLTRLMPGPHGLIRSVVPISAYRDVRDVRHERKVSKATNVALDTREAKSLALIRSLPAIGNIE